MTDVVRKMVLVHQENVVVNMDGVVPLIDTVKLIKVAK